MKYIKRYEMIDFQEDWEDEEQYKDTWQYRFVLYRGDENNIYLVQKVTGEKTMILFKDMNYQMMDDSPIRSLRPRRLDDLFLNINDDLRNQIISNRKRINIYNPIRQSWEFMYYDKLIEKYPGLEGII